MHSFYFFLSRLYFNSKFAVKQCLDPDFFLLNPLLLSLHLVDLRYSGTVSFFLLQEFAIYFEKAHNAPKIS
jgi:hypothetical protein